MEYGCKWVILCIIYLLILNFSLIGFNELRLHRENPTIDFHVEEYTMMRPNFNEDEWVTDKNWVLDENYCVHLYDQ